jgi:hypothetical protein
MAETAVARQGVSIALACRTFGVSETCYRYSPKLCSENEQIADLLDDFNREGLGIEVDFSLPAERMVRSLTQFIFETIAGVQD